MPLVRAIATEAEGDTALLVTPAGDGLSAHVSLVSVPLLRDRELSEWDRGLVRQQLRAQERLWWIEPGREPGELARAEPFIGDTPMTAAFGKQGLAITVADHPLPWARKAGSLAAGAAPTFIDRAQQFTELFTGGVFLITVLLMVAVRRRAYGVANRTPAPGVRGALGRFLRAYVPFERTVGRPMLPPKDQA